MMPAFFRRPRVLCFGREREGVSDLYAPVNDLWIGKAANL